MGQYYMVLTIDKNGKHTVYDRNVNKQYTMAKLLEHSWWFNPFVNTICGKIFHKPKQIAWVGDYANSEGIEFKYYDEVWGDNVKTVGVTEAQVCLWDKYLVNHTKQVYIDCDEYYEKSLEENGYYCIHPLPLLTCVGNGLGGGDYSGSNMDMVGTWCLDNISVECKGKFPDNGKKSILYTKLKEYRKIDVKDVYFKESRR